MSQYISSNIATIGELFEQNRALNVPPFQRQYSWSLAVASTLLHDLFDAFEGDRELPYFMGGVIFSTPAGSHAIPPTANGNGGAGHGPEAPIQLEIVDGQQRIATFSMIIAVLRDFESHPDREQVLHALLALRDPPILRQRAWRLELGFFDKTYFEHVVQTRGATLRALNIEPPDRDSWRRIYEAVRYFRQALSEKTAEWRHDFAEYLLGRCMVDVITLSAPTIVFHVFRTMNARGQRPQAPDLLKSVLFQLAQFEEADARNHSSAWHEWETALGDRAFEEMFSHIRTLLDRNHRGETMESLTRAVRQIGARQFLEQMMPEYFAAYSALNSGQPSPPFAHQRVKTALRRLKWLDHQSWRPAALAALLKGDDRDGAAARFFGRLEALGCSMQLLRNDRDERRRRYRKIVNQIQDGAWAEAVNGDVSLTAQEKERLRNRLRTGFGEESARLALYVVNDILAPGETEAADFRVSLEHVLPRRPEAHSQWRVALFPTEQDMHGAVNLLGNMALAPEAKNRRADRKDLAEKQAILAVNGVEFATCRDVVDAKTWDMAAVRARTERFAQALETEWGL